MKHIDWHCPDGDIHQIPVFPLLRTPNKNGGHKTWSIGITYRSGTPSPYHVVVVAKGNENDFNGKHYQWAFSTMATAVVDAGRRYWAKTKKYNEILNEFPWESQYNESTAVDVTDRKGVDKLKPSEVLNFLDKYAT